MERFYHTLAQSQMGILYFYFSYLLHHYLCRTFVSLLMVNLHCCGNFSAFASATTLTKLVTKNFVMMASWMLFAVLLYFQQKQLSSFQSECVIIDQTLPIPLASQAAIYSPTTNCVYLLGGRTRDRRNLWLENILLLERPMEWAMFDQ
jgi:hypothetical protein